MAELFINLMLQQMHKPYYMRRSLLFLFLAIIQNGFTQKKNNNTAINTAIAKMEQKVIAWRHDFHQYPELGNRETRTATIIARHLQSLGIEVKTNIAKTGVVGILKGNKPGPVIALRADMDGLPVTEKTNLPFASKAKGIYNGQEVGVMHACGHDAHVAILMGVAEILAGMKKELKGTVKFIFQPAEEGSQKGEEGGAELMVKEGVLEDPKVDVIFGLHMNAQVEVGKITYRPGSTFAGVADMKITVKGKPAHGAKPWISVDPIVVASQIVGSLQTIVSRNVNIAENAAVVTIGTIHGGTRFNIIADQVEMTGTIRTLSATDEANVFGRIKQIAEKTAEAAGATAVVEIPCSAHYPVTFNNEALTAAMLPSFQKTVGKENVLLVAPETISEDFSFFAQKVPGLYFYIGGMPKGKDPATAASHHTPDFFIDDSAYKTGLNVFCNLVFDYMEMNKK